MLLSSFENLLIQFFFDQNSYYSATLGSACLCRLLCWNIKTSLWQLKVENGFELTCLCPAPFFPWCPVTTILAFGSVFAWIAAALFLMLRRSKGDPWSHMFYFKRCWSLDPGNKSTRLISVCKWLSWKGEKKTIILNVFVHDTQVCRHISLSATHQTPATTFHISETQRWS